MSYLNKNRLLQANLLQYYYQSTTHRWICSSLSVRAKQNHVNSFAERTHTCGQLTKDDIGKKVKLFGWIQSSRFDNKIIDLRDKYGVTQCIVDKNLLADSLRKKPIPNESVVRIIGTVRPRPSKQLNRKLTTGDIEIQTDQLEILSTAKSDLPILQSLEPTRDADPKLETRFRYRYLNLRSQDMQRTLKFRSNVINILRNKLHELEFIDCVTPTLCKRTPGGANEFIVPTKIKDKYYCLPQSPQLFKQLLMISCLDRYYQFCLCYRDESGHADRQPEFTQLDIEMSFTNQELIMKLVEDILFYLSTKLSQDDANFQDLLNSFSKESRKIERMAYQEAIEKYGTDKPDIRFEWFIESFGDNSGLQLRIPHSVSQDEIQNLMPQHAIECNLSSLLSVKCDDDGSTSLRIADTSLEARTLLGTLRHRISKHLDKKKIQVYNSKFKFLWVVDFPLFVSDGESGKLEPNHHPFTAPTRESSKFLDTDPPKVVGQHYDLVLNGQEIAGGSIRIHDPELQSKILAKVLGYDESTFEFFIDALRSGCPPHGGIAFGFDRLLAILLDTDTIKDVIPFPKSNSGRDLMSGCPHEIDSGTKKMYNL